MGDISNLRDILNDTPADAISVEWNFNTIQTYLNSDVAQVDGSKAFTGPVTLSSTAPSNPLHAVRLQDLDSVVPAGVVVDWAGDTAPTDWLLCDGSVVSQLDHPNLYGVVADKFNTGGEGGTQFRVPDFRQRVSVGKGAAAAFDTIGETGGQADTALLGHTHTMVHVHTINHGHSDNFAVVSGGGSHTHTPEASREIHDFKDIVENGGWPTSGGAGLIYNNTAGVSRFGPLAAGWAGFWAAEKVTLGSASTAHGHTLSGAVVAHSGSSGGSSPAATAGAGEAVTNKNYPPFVIMNKIIKAG